MEKIKDLLRDAALSFLLGLGIGLALAAAAALIGAVVNGLQGALEGSRGIVLVVGGLLMIYSAILMLKGGNLPPDAFSLRPWKQRRVEEPDDMEPLRLFRRLPGQYTFFLMAVGVLTVSLLPESVVLHYL